MVAALGLVEVLDSRPRPRGSRRRKKSRSWAGIRRGLEPDLVEVDDPGEVVVVEGRGVEAGRLELLPDDGQEVAPFGWAMMYSALSQRSFWRSNLAWTSFISDDLEALTASAGGMTSRPSRGIQPRRIR